jgi:hypothetical protein
MPGLGASFSYQSMLTKMQKFSSSSSPARHLAMFPDKNGHQATLLLDGNAHP